MLYLENQIKILEPHEKLVSLKIDEIHIQPQISYSARRISGFAANKTDIAANQVQAFMISSLLSKYKDIVKLIPVKSNTAEFLHESTLQVINDLSRVGYQICCITGDNSRINRSCFQKFLSKSNGENYFFYPDRTNRIYIMHDAPHMIKCIRNNWLCTQDVNKSFKFPNFENPDSYGIASFKLMRDIYHREKHSILKRGYSYTFEPKKY